MALCGEGDAQGPAFPHAGRLPATNQEIATELCLSIPATKTHLRALFHAFGIDDLPQNEKRRELAALAFVTGLVREGEL